MILGRRRFQSSKARDKRRRKLLFRFYVFLGIFLVLLGGLAFSSRLDAVLIEDISIEGNSITPDDSIRRIVESELNGSYFFILPRDNSIVYPRDGIRDEILNRIKRIDRVELSLEDLKTLTVRVHERDPVAIWCDQGMESESEADPSRPTRAEAEDCFFVDNLGLVYSGAPAFSGNVFLKYYGDISGNPVGKQILSEEYFKNLSSFVKTVEERGFEIISISIDKFRDLETKLKDGGRIIFNSEQDLEILADDLDSIFSDENFLAGFEGGRELDYIDLRFGSKVYFKFR